MSAIPCTWWFLRSSPARLCCWAASVLLGYAAGVGAAFTGFVYGYEQPALARRYGAQYQAYRRAVPGWWPRLRPAQIPRLDLAACPLGPRPDRRQTGRSSRKMTGWRPAGDNRPGRLRKVTSVLRSGAGQHRRTARRSAFIETVRLGVAGCRSVRRGPMGLAPEPPAGRAPGFRSMRLLRRILPWRGSKDAM